jgi:hypothetical protein
LRPKLHTVEPARENVPVNGWVVPLGEGDALMFKLDVGAGVTYTMIGVGVGAGGAVT